MQAGGTSLPPAARTPQPARTRRRLARLATAATGTGIVAGAWYGLRVEGVQRADVRAGDALRRIGSPPIERAVVATTDLGSLYAVAGAAGVLALAGHRTIAADVAALGALAWVVAQRSKTVVRRDRPYEADGARRLIRRPTGSSFPSGHAAVATATATLLAGRVPQRAAALGLLGLGAYVAGSRVYAGVHYPSDALGGVGIGLVLAAAWTGPVAAAGRAGATAAARLARRAAPRAMRLALGLRRRPRQDAATLRG